MTLPSRILPDGVLPMPDFLNEIAQHVGVENALKLAASYGGTRKYIPSRNEITAEHWLAQILGFETAQYLCDQLVGASTGMTMLLPIGPTHSTIERWRAMHELIAKGIVKRDIARVCQVHERTVQRHRNQYSNTHIAHQARQLPLFQNSVSLPKGGSKR